MAKKKLQRFAELGTFPNVIQPEVIYPPIDHELKGKWNERFFKNKNPIVLELGCGRGEYTIALARQHPEKNFIGIDIKGARLWRGSKTAIEENITNTGFLRIPIEQIMYYFASGEVSEIWITFPDPQPQQSRETKRLSSPAFIDRYKKILTPYAIVHLKTDDKGLFEYTVGVLKDRSYPIKIYTDNLYASKVLSPILETKTTYEQMFLKKEKNICYLNFIIQ